MSFARSKFARRHCALLLTAAIAAAGCADPADLGADVEAEKAAPPSALAFGLSLMSNFNGVVSLLGTFGLDVSALIGGGDGTVTLSQESLDAIAEIVDNALHAQYLTEGDASLQSLMTYQGLYIRRDCLGRLSCTEFELDTMREDIGLVEEAAIDLYDRLNVLGDRRLQVGAPLMTAGASRLFALHETALLEATAGSSVSTIERQIRDTADDILDDISDIEALYNRKVASQFSEGVSCSHGGRRCCYRTPRGESCSSRGRGIAERLLNQAKTTWRAWTLGPEGEYQAFRRRLVQLKNGETIELEPQSDDVACDNRINAGQTVSLGNTRTSCNGRFQLKAANNVVIQRLEEDNAGYITRTTIWETDTSGRNYGLQLTDDGQLQVRARSYIWRAGVTAGAGAYALLHDDGELVVYRSNDDAAWSSVDGLIGQPEPEPADGVTFGRSIALLGAHNKYFVAENNLNVDANRSRVGPWEKFSVRNASGQASNGAVEWGDTISLYTAHRKFMVAERDGRLLANRNSAGSWERFTVVDPGNTGRRSGAVPCGATIALRSAHNKYVVAESDGRANADRSRPGSWERIRVICQ